MRYKPDWPEARERLRALWEGSLLDRPCIAVLAPSGGNVVEPRLPAAIEDYWLRPDWLVPSALARLENTWWGGEAVPSVLLMSGWIVSLGGKPRFSMDTIWFDTFSVDLGGPSPFRYDPDDAWSKKHEAAYMALVDAAGKDDFLVGQPCLLPANDLLSMHMGTDAFLLALVEHPDWMREAIARGARDLLRARLGLRDLILDRHEFWYGNAGWMPFWAPEPYMATQSDVSCMLSPRMFDAFVLPELEVYGNEFGALWYHLDGGNARQHLPRLLLLPYVRVIQYTPAPGEPPNGPAHLDFYREIQEAGKIVHIDLPKENIEPLVRRLDPALLMLQTGCGSIDEGQSLLDSARRWI